MTFTNLLAPFKLGSNFIICTFLFQIVQNDQAGMEVSAAKTFQYKLFLEGLGTAR